MHQNTDFNIVQAESNQDRWNVIKGQRMPGGYAAPGAQIVMQGLTRAEAIREADLFQAEHDAEQANLTGKADRLRELTQGGEWVPEPEQTPPAPSLPHVPTLDELTGAIKEAAEHGDWRAIHAYALELATLAVTNI